MILQASSVIPQFSEEQEEYQWSNIDKNPFVEIAHSPCLQCYSSLR